MVARKNEYRETQVNAIAARINPIFRPEVVQEAIDELGRCLKATKRVRVRQPGGAVSYEEVPDQALRAAVAVKIVEFEFGKAVQRSIHADVTPKQVETSPAEYVRGLMAGDKSKQGVIESARRVLDAIENANATEVQATPPLTEDPKKAPESQSGGSTT